MKKAEKGADQSEEREPEQEAGQSEDPDDAGDPVAEDASEEKRPQQEPSDAALDEPERPLFTQSWPADAELDLLLTAFGRGNYAYVREHAPKVAERATDPAVKAAALDLRKRIDPAPLAGILIFVAVGLLVVLAGHYLGKHNPGAPPTVTPASTNAPLQPPAPK